MNKIILSSVFVLGAFAVFADTPERRTVTLESLLDEMCAPLPQSAQPFAGRLWSSYDRRSVRNDGKADGWYANNDWSNWLRTEKVGGRTECVMVDAKGPGVVTRIWTANGERTVLRLYLDGASEPTWTGLATNFMFGLSQPIPFPLRNEISPKVDPRHRAYNLYLPIPYAKSFRLTAELPNPKHRFWYNVETRAYADRETPVETLTPSVLARAEGAIARAAQTLRKEESSNADADILQYVRKDLPPGASETLTVERASGARPEREGLAVCGFDLGLDGETMMDLRLRMSFDGEETVDVRAAQLLGMKTFAQLPMPFVRTCKMTVENLGTKPVDLTRARVRVVPRKWDAATGLHFGAYGFALTNISTHVGAAGYYEIPWLKLEGEGFLVGHALLLENRANYKKCNGWWGEGDEKIFVDGETFPSYFGTGTEDFFGYAWGPNRSYDAAPFLMMPQADSEPDAKGRHRGTIGRLRKLDTVPFHTSVRLDVELWHWQKATMDYAPATFWYARPGAKVVR